MSNIYSEMILEYYKHPNIHNHSYNPLCGDKNEIFIKLDESKSKIQEITFDGEGCAISIASASMTTLLMKEKTLKEALELDKDELLDMLGIQLSPNRLKCALLGLDTVKNGIRNYFGANVEIKE
jgi:nitrogen fixation NifU-like protein